MEAYDICLLDPMVRFLLQLHPGVVFRVLCFVFASLCLWSCLGFPLSHIGCVVKPRRLLHTDTWGLGLDDYHQAYPYLLSPDVHNVAVQTGGPSIGAVCAQTMIGGTDETHGPYHVILLDFVRFAKQGLLVLAKRLRQRYPQAIILLLQRWTPQHIVDNGNNNSTVTASEWAQANHIAIGSESFLEEWNKTNATLWSFAGLQNRVVLDTASAVEGHILQFPPDHGSNAKTYATVAFAPAVLSTTSTPWPHPTRAPSAHQADTPQSSRHATACNNPSSKRQRPGHGDMGKRR